MITSAALVCKNSVHEIRYDCLTAPGKGHSPTLPSLYLRHNSFTNPSVATPTSQFILQPFFRFSYVTSSSSFSKLSVTLPTSQLNLQPFRSFTYVTAHSPTLPLLHRRHSSFSNPSFDSPTSQALHLIHLASRPWSYRHVAITFYATLVKL